MSGSGAPNALGTTSNPFALTGGSSAGGTLTPAPAPNDVGIVVGTQALFGWEEVRITRGIERVPSTFDIRLTERFPNQAGQIVITPGDPCRVMIGNETVLTGYVDRYTAALGSQTHTVVINGRSLLEDMIDSSAIFPGFQVSNRSLYSLASLLAAPYGISVSVPNGDSDTIPVLNAILTETAYEILERVARWANKLIYDDTAGNMVIANIGNASMASGFSQGQNVQAASVTFSCDDRFTQYNPVYTSTAYALDGPPNPAAALQSVTDGPTVYDTSFPNRADGKPRYRPLVIVSPQNQISADLATRFAQWEMARRYGRSQAVKLTCDSWRDSAGKLWQPNSFAALNLPELKLVNKTWLIAEVTFVRDQDGTTAEITLMPPEAFLIQKEILVPFQWQVGEQVPAGGAAAQQ